MGDAFSLLADWLVARSRAWETNQELFELTKRARSRLGGSDSRDQRALGIFPLLRWVLSLWANEGLLCLFCFA